MIGSNFVLYYSYSTILNMEPILCVSLYFQKTPFGTAERTKHTKV